MRNTISTFDKVCEMLEKIGFVPRILGNNHSIRVGLRNRLGLFDIAFCVEEEPSLLHMSICLPLVVQDNSRVQIAELVVRINNGWPFGHLDLDMSTGLLSVRGSIPVEDGEITTGQFRYLLDGGMAMIDRYLLAIDRLILGADLSPAEVIAEVEMAEA